MDFFEVKLFLKTIMVNTFQKSWSEVFVYFNSTTYYSITKIIEVGFRYQVQLVLSCKVIEPYKT